MAGTPAPRQAASLVGTSTPHSPYLRRALREVSLDRRKPDALGVADFDVNHALASNGDPQPAAPGPTNDRGRHVGDAGSFQQCVNVRRRDGHDNPRGGLSKQRRLHGVLDPLLEQG